MSEGLEGIYSIPIVVCVGTNPTSVFNVPICEQCLHIYTGEYKGKLRSYP